MRSSTVTLTIKNVPLDVARRVRARAEANRRSLQQELLLWLENSSAPATAPAEPVYRVEQPAPARYDSKTREARHSPLEERLAAVPAGGKLSLNELWERARRLGQRGDSESADIVRRDRDALDRR